MLMVFQILGERIYSVNRIKAIVCVFGKKYAVRFLPSAIYKVNFKRIKELNARHKTTKN